MTTNHAQMHLGRRDMARELAQKLTGQQEESEAELRRCEGAMGALAQMQEALSKQRAAFEVRAESNCPEDLTEDQIQARLDGKIAVDDFTDEIEGGYRNLKTAAELNMVALRGRISMVEAALDLCESAFEQESGALQEVIKAVADLQQAEATEKTEKAKKRAVQRARREARKAGKHPGEPIARSRKAGGVKK